MLYFCGLTVYYSLIYKLFCMQNRNLTMNNFSFTQSEDARHEALNFVKNSLEKGSWEKHQACIHNIKTHIENHSLFKHPILAKLKNKELNLIQLKEIHSHYFIAIVKIFTDALSILIYNCHVLERNKNIQDEKRILAKVHARYLLSLNLIDELGFNTHNLALSSPNKSHLAYFINLLEQLRIAPIDEEQADIEAKNIQNFIKHYLFDYQELLLILAITEQQVIAYSEALSVNIANYGSELTEGYYACHGLVGNGENLANDDNHQDDIWTLLTQALDVENFNHLYLLAEDYANHWLRFWTKMSEKLEI